MISYRQLVAGGLVAGILLMTSACTVAVRDDLYYHGPPPHAPAHGYRYHYRDHGVSLVFDSHLRLYLVLDFPGYYYHHGYYYHWDDYHWLRSKHFRRGWQHFDQKHLPKKLYKRHYHKHHRP